MDVTAGAKRTVKEVTRKERPKHRCETLQPFELYTISLVCHYGFVKKTGPKNGSKQAHIWPVSGAGFGDIL